MKRRRMDEIRFQFMGKGIWIMRGELREERRIIRVIYSRIILDSIEKREGRYD